MVASFFSFFFPLKLYWVFNSFVFLAGIKKALTIPVRPEEPNLQYARLQPTFGEWGS